MSPEQKFLSVLPVTNGQTPKSALKCLRGVKPRDYSTETLACLLQGKGEEPEYLELDLSKELTRQEYEAIVQQALQTHEQDAEGYLKKVQARMER